MSSTVGRTWKTTVLPPRARDSTATYVALQRSATFARLRSRSRRYLAAMTALFLAAVLLAVWLPGPLALPFAVGLILLPPLVSAVHLRYAGRRLDPLAARVREDLAARVREDLAARVREDLAARVRDDFEGSRG